MTILEMKQWTKDMGEIPYIYPIDETRYDELWSFWGLENVYPKIAGKKRLRYHLGHVLLTQKLQKIHHEIGVKPILVDYLPIQQHQQLWSQEDKEKTVLFLKRMIDNTIEPEPLMQYIEKVKCATKIKTTYASIRSQISSLVEPVQVAYEELKKNEHTLFYLEKYRDIGVNDLKYIPPCLAYFYENSSIQDIVPPHIFFASVFALHRSSMSDSDFINGLWVQEGFPFLACIKEFESKNICVIEGRRSAYIWLFIDYLRIMYNNKNNCKLDLPDVGYLDSLPSLYGASFMQRDVPEEALFIDSSLREIEKKVSHMSLALRREYSLRLFGSAFDPQYDSSQWERNAVKRCENIRNQINELCLDSIKNEVKGDIIKVIVSLHDSIDPVTKIIKSMFKYLKPRGLPKNTKKDGYSPPSRNMIINAFAKKGIEVKSLEHFSKGWDCIVYLLNQDMILRIPRRQSVVSRIRDEICFLELIRENQWVCIPHYQDIFTNIDFITGYPILKGEAACTLDDVKSNIAVIMKFLSWLHGINKECCIELKNANNLLSYRKNAKKAFSVIRSQLKPAERSFLQIAINRNLPNSEPKVVIHNDLRPDHILISNEKVSIIDWTDIAWACPWEEFLWLWISWGDDIFGYLKEHYDGWRDEWIHCIRTVGSWKIAMEYYYGLTTADDAKLYLAKQALNRCI